MSDEMRELLVREVPVGIPEDGDGRTIEARIVPYNTPTMVVDRVENGGTGIPYTETWLPGAFSKQAGALSRVKVWLNFEHEQGLRGIVGHGAQLDDRDDALYGTFRVHENTDGDKALQMVRDGLLTGISLEAFPLRSRKIADGVERVRAHLEKVSLCRIGAYSEAQVLALRQEPDEESIELPEFPTAEVADAVRAELVSERTSEAELALQRVGFEPLLVRNVTRKPWDATVTRFEDSEFQRSCLIDRGGDLPAKERCSLPILEPNGDVNTNALTLASQVLSGARGGLKHVSLEQKAAAARKLIRYLAQTDLEPSPSLRKVASK